MDTPDDTLVYVDPDNRTVIGPVEWEGDEPKKRPREQTENPSKKIKTKRMYYPYCTIRTAKHFLWKKRPSPEDRKLSLDDALEKAVMEPFWD
jgi:hypothetical protein